VVVPFEIVEKDPHPCFLSFYSWAQMADTVFRFLVPLEAFGLGRKLNIISDPFLSGESGGDGFGSEVSMDRPVHGRTWTDMDMDGRTDVHGLL
jgi:hypothetical protein